MPEKGRPPQAIPSADTSNIKDPNTHTHTHIYILPISRILIHTYICIYTKSLLQIIISVQAKLDIARRKHIVHPTGFGAMMYKHLTKHSFVHAIYCTWHTVTQITLYQMELTESIFILLGPTYFWTWRRFSWLWSTTVVGGHGQGAKHWVSKDYGLLSYHQLGSKTSLVAPDDSWQWCICWWKA